MFLTPEFLAIAMEYAAGGDMFQLVVRQRGLPEADARWYFQQLIIAIDYCHRMVSLQAVCQLQGRWPLSQATELGLGRLGCWQGHAACCQASCSSEQGSQGM